MKLFVHRVVKDIRRGENIDLIVTLVLGLVIAALNLLGIASQELVSSVTLATLALIAVGLLVTRYRIEDMHVKGNLSNTVQFELRQPTSITRMIGEAEEVWMIGLVLRNTTSNNFYNFRRNVSQGARIRALIVDMNKVDVNNLVRRFSRAATPDHFRVDFDQVLRQYREFRQSASAPDNVQLGLLDFVPSYSLYIFPRAENGGLAYVELYGYRSEMGSIPRFIVTRRDNPDWYEYFASQFEMMSRAAEPVSL